MNRLSLLHLAPIIITAGTAVLVMLSLALRRSNVLAAGLSVVGLNIALITLIFQGMYPLSAGSASGFFEIDSFARFYMALVLLSSLACLTFSYAYFKGFPDHSQEIYLLLLLATVGALMLPPARNLPAFFIGIELLSVPIYPLLAYARQSTKSLESGFKYLILSASASATLLFGMAVVFAGTNTMDFAALGGIGFNQSYMIVGTALIIVAVGFKLSVAPFHQWVADVYQGTPEPITVFLATAAKVAVFAAVVRLIHSVGIIEHGKLLTVLTSLALASMLIGNLFALRQRNFLRILALSSVAHIGYALTAVISDPEGALTTVNFYLANYVFTGIGAFGAISVIASPYKKALKSGDPDYFTGLFWRRPWISIVLTIMFLSFSGFPMTVGFVAKLLIIFDVAKLGEWLLLVVVIIGSGLGIYYYLKSVLLMYAVPKHAHYVNVRRYWYREIDGIILILILMFVVCIGIWPQPLISLSAIAHW